MAVFFGSDVFSAYDVKAWKPDPELFLYAAQKMSFKPEECLVVKDSIVGINAGKAVKMSTVLYDPKGVHANTNGINKIKYFSEMLGVLK